jgi:predicted porin
MKTYPLTLLALLSAVGAAQAQSTNVALPSSLTLYGTADVGLSYGDGSVSNKTALTSSNMAPSRIGIKGEKDLGAGLSASFIFEGDIQPDSGAGMTVPVPGLNTNQNNLTATNTAGGFSFNRVSYVGLSGNYGQLRLGRDFTPTFWVSALSYPMDFNGAGMNPITLNALNYGGMMSVIYMRASNSVSYLTPASATGFRGQVTYALGENSSNAANPADGNYFGARAGFAKGPFSVDIAAAKGGMSAVGDISTTNLATTYDFGFARVALQITSDKEGVIAANLERTGRMVSMTAPVGLGKLKASYAIVKTTTDTAPSKEFNQISVGYAYPLNSSTWLYGTYARVSNSSASNYTVNGGVTAVGGDSQGVDFGIRYDF